MVKNTAGYLIPWMALVGLLALINCGAAPQADLVIHNGTIYTLNAERPVAGVVAVKDSRIIHVGPASEAGEWTGAAVKTLDLQGQTLTPGFIESHAHFMGLGGAKLRLSLNDTRSYEAMVSRVAEAASNTPPGEWILGRGWHQSKWDSLPEMVRGFQTHQALSAVSPRHPVFLRHASGHAGIANAKAMEIAGITADTEVEGDGEVIKDAAGNPTGIFTENAMALIETHIPPSTPERQRRAMELALQTCLKNGITTFHDAGAGSADIAVFKEFLEEGRLTVRLYVMLAGWEEGLLEKWYEKGPEIGLGENYLTIRAIKLSADGALGSRGAWLLEPYADRPGHTGHATIAMKEVYQTARQALQHGFQLATHAIGDRTNREVLDQYQRAFAEFPAQARDCRFRIEHAQHLSAADIPRFAELGVIPAMQGIHMASDRPWAINRLGKERIEEGAYVWQKLLQSGARIINGTDAPVEPLDPLACFYASVTRRTLEGEPPGGYEPEQKMSREQALRSYTLDAAYGAFEEDIKGSIEVGKLADFTVFSQDIMTVPEERLLDTRIVHTIINGNIAYTR